MSRCRLQVRGDVLIDLPDGPLLVACVLRPDDREVRELVSSPEPLVLGAHAPTWVPRWDASRLVGVELRMRLACASRCRLSVHFALPERARTLAHRPERIVLTDQAGFDDFGHRRVLRRGVMLPTGAPDVLAELLDTTRPRLQRDT